MKSSVRNTNPEALLWLLLGVWWIVNLVQAGFTELANDEAYYWLFAQDLDWGYFDHPPMTALLVKMGSFIGGTLGIRFFFILLQPIYLYIIYKIIKPATTTSRDIVLFVVICAALPILQLYGFIAVPDGPLLFFTALFLLSFKWLTEKNRWVDAIFMGLTMAALAYSKYHAVLVVIFALLSYPKIFRNPKFYVAGLITVAAILPHMIWQYNHDWVSFRYHFLGRNANFRIDYFIEFILNIVVIFNPLFFPLYIKRWIKVKSENPVQRAIYTITLGFILFFIVSSVRGYVQPQWIIPAAFGAILLLWRLGIENHRVGRYSMIAGLATITLALAFRIVIIFNPFDIKFEVFDNRLSYGAIAEAAAGRPVIFDSNYAVAAKYKYYTGGTAYSQASVSHRSSQWEFMDDDTRAAGRAVIVEAGGHEAATTLKLANDKIFRYNVIENFRPTRKIVINFDRGDIPETVAPGQRLMVNAIFENPYDYTVSISPDSVRVMAVFNLKTLTSTLVPVAFEPVDIVPGGRAEVSLEFIAPDIAAGKYHYGFTIVAPHMQSWFNSKTHNVKISR